MPLPLPDDHDFLFHLTAQVTLIMYTHIVDYKTTRVLIRNVSDRLLQILRYYKLGHIINISYKKCFLAKLKITFNSAIFLPTDQPYFNLHFHIIASTANASIEIQLNNGMRLYGDTEAVKEIVQLVAKYLSIMEYEDFMRILLEYCINIFLKSGWESKLSTIKQRVYPFGNNVCHVVDKIFDKIFCQN